MEFKDVVGQQLKPGDQIAWATKSKIRTGKIIKITITEFDIRITARPADRGTCVSLKDFGRIAKIFTQVPVVTGTPNLSANNVIYHGNNYTLARF